MTDTQPTTEGRTPLEAPLTLDLGDRESAARRLEVVRSHLPARVQYRVEPIAECHHFEENAKPAFGVFGPHTWAEFEDSAVRINAWIAERGVDWLVAESERGAVPLRARPEPRSVEPGAAAKGGTNASLGA